MWLSYGTLLKMVPTIRIMLKMSGGSECFDIPPFIWLWAFIEKKKNSFIPQINWNGSSNIQPYKLMVMSVKCPSDSHGASY